LSTEEIEEEEIQDGEIVGDEEFELERDREHERFKNSLTSYCSSHYDGKGRFVIEMKWCSASDIRQIEAYTNMKLLTIMSFKYNRVTLTFWSP